MSQTLSGLFLVGAFKESNRQRKRKRTIREILWKNRENPGKIGKVPKRTKRDKTGRTSPDRETPPFDPPHLLALDIVILIPRALASKPHCAGFSRHYKIPTRGQGMAKMGEMGQTLCRNTSLCFLCGGRSTTSIARSLSHNPCYSIFCGVSQTIAAIPSPTTQESPVCKRGGIICFTESGGIAPERVSHEMLAPIAL